MRFLALGPVTVLDGDREVPFDRAKTRYLLGVLLLARGRPVAVDTMMEALWDHDRPKHVRKDLQSYVSRVRHTLRAARCTAQLHSQNGSYLLQAPDDEIDYDTSLALLESAREAKERGDLDHSAGLLKTAVELWRGPPLQGLDTMWMELHREDLDLQLTSCKQLHIEVELLRRKYLDALKLVNEYTKDPEFDRVFISQTLMALNGCGFYDKFDSYWSQIRQAGIEAFGTEPDSELRNLQLRLLQERDGHHATLSSATANSSPLPSPAQLPPPSADFVGRGEELDALDEALGRTRATRPTAMPVIAVVGGVATGKTALAVEWSHNNRRRFSEGQLFADLNGFDLRPPADPFDVLADFLIALGIAQDRLPGTTERRTSLFRSVVAGRQLLVVLDNARDTEQVRPLLPGSSSCVVVVTSRHRLPDLVSRHAARRITLEALPRPAATALLRHSVEVDRPAQEPSAVSTAVDLCGSLPGLLRVMADVLVDRPHLRLEDLVVELRRSADQMLPFGGGENDALTVETRLSWSFDALAPATARTFRLISLHLAGDFGVGETAALVDAHVPEVQQHLHALWSVHLLRQSSHQRYRFLDLELAFARRRFRLDHDEDDRTAALHRLLEWYLHTAGNAVRGLWSSVEPPVPEKSSVEPLTFTGAPDTLVWLRVEQANLVAAVREAADLGTQEAWLLPLVLHPYHVHAERVADWHDAYASALRGAHDAGDDRSEVSAHLALAASAHALARDDDAEKHLVSALAMAEELRFDHEKSAALRELGMLAHRRGDSPAGIEYCEEARQTDLKAGHRAGEAASSHCAGLIRSERGEHADAIVDFERALAIREDLDLRVEVAAGWCELGLAHLRLGGHEQAFDHCARVVDISGRHAAHRIDLTRALLVLGEVEHHRGNHFKALTHLHRSLALCHPLNDKALAAHALDLLGTAFRSLGQSSNAGEEWQQALLLLTDLDDPHAEHIRARLADLTSTQIALPDDTETPDTGGAEHR